MYGPADRAKGKVGRHWLWALAVTFGQSLLLYAAPPTGVLGEG